MRFIFCIYLIFILFPWNSYSQNYLCTAQNYFNVMSNGNSKTDEFQNYLISLGSDKLTIEEVSSSKKDFNTTNFVLISSTKNSVVGISSNFLEIPLFTSLVFNLKELKMTKTVNSSYGASVINLDCAKR